MDIFSAAWGSKLRCKFPEAWTLSVRMARGRRYIFALNHLSQTADMLLPDGDFVDLISGRTHSGALSLDANEVVVLNRTGSSCTPQPIEKPAPIRYTVVYDGRSGL